GGKKRNMADRALPQLGYSRLLHMPLNVRYLLTSHLTGFKKVGQISRIEVLYVSIRGSPYNSASLERPCMRPRMADACNKISPTLAMWTGLGYSEDSSFTS